MKKLLGILLFFCINFVQSQTISVDNGYSNAELAQLFLSNSCSNISNIQLSDPRSVQYFNNNNGDFPIREGIIIRSGDAALTQGIIDTTKISSAINDNGDPFLESLNANSGRSEEITDVAFFEFEFIPFSEDFGFEFLFASNEYGEFQCKSNDVFAFLLTDLTTGDVTNLAIVPGTSDPVSVSNIREGLLNGNCESVNAEFFDKYFADDPASATLNMLGHTKVLRASATLIPERPYRIRMVIGDAIDNNFDSAIFLSAGTFNAAVDLGDDFTLCEGDSRILGTGINPASFTHRWTKNGVTIAGETGNELEIQGPGTYEVFVNESVCSLTDMVEVAPLAVTPPENLVQCFNSSGTYSFNLLENNEAGLGIDPDDFDVTFFASRTDLDNNNAIPNNQLTVFPGTHNQQIFLKIGNPNESKICETDYSFRLLINREISPGTPADLEVCPEYDNRARVDLTQTIPEILNGEPASDFIISFFQNQSDANLNRDVITDPDALVVPQNQSGKQIWARMATVSQERCFVLVPFRINIGELVPVQVEDDAFECFSFILPQLDAGNSYYTGPDGTGTPLNAGDPIVESRTVFIFNPGTATLCPNQSSFEVTLIEDYALLDSYCGSFIVPDLKIGNFYTESGGNGTRLDPEQELFNDQTIFLYAINNEGDVCTEKELELTIDPLPLVDERESVITCIPFKLGPLTFGSYYTRSNGRGENLMEGDVISETQTLFIYNDNGTCTNESEFLVDVLNNFDTDSISACGEHFLRPISSGGYYSEPNGQGQQFDLDVPIVQSRQIYYFAETTVGENCTNDLSYYVEIKEVPAVSEFQDVILCQGATYTLTDPPTIGQFFLQPGRGGEELQLPYVVSETTVIYVNNQVGECAGESSFLVEIRPPPPLPKFFDQNSCGPYELETPNLGIYYTQPNKGGMQLNPGDILSESQRIYVFAEYDDLEGCTSETFFEVDVQNTNLVPETDRSFCDAHTLPALTAGTYYWEPGGVDEILPDEMTLTETRTVYVYSETDNRFPCIFEEIFTVTITQTPVLEDFLYDSSCGSYTLPDLGERDYNIGYYRSPNGEDPITGDELTIAIAGTYRIYVYAYAEENPDCFDQKTFDFTVFPRPVFEVPPAYVCFDADTDAVVSSAVLRSGLDPLEFVVNWYKNGNLVHTGVDFITDELGVYDVETEKINPEVRADCNYLPTSVEVRESGKPLAEVTVTRPFAEVAVAEVEIIKGFGDYEFSLDGGEFQLRPEFTDVSSGIHTITIRNIENPCGEIQVNFRVLNYPKFFSPNGDGINEIWTIDVLNTETDATKIVVFDRFGRLMTSFRPDFGLGWDGTFSGSKMPRDDYWFRVEYEFEGQKQEHRGHFTLVR
ncbi:MAG: choice-of-anchor L domain-containing protein [Leeuwenhoekiella sp.]